MKETRKILRATLDDHSRLLMAWDTRILRGTDELSQPYWTWRLLPNRDDKAYPCPVPWLPWCGILHYELMIGQSYCKTSFHKPVHLFFMQC